MNDAEAGVLVLSLKAGGVGPNLQKASYVFHFDRWWNPASEAQADDRAHRIGQTRGVSVYKYICEGTIEERIHEILRAKRALFADYVDDVCMDLGTRLTEQELFGLFGLRPPAKRDAAGRRAVPLLSLEDSVRRHLSLLGYRVDIAYRSGDGQTDLVAEMTDEMGLETVLLVRCVEKPGPAGLGAIRDLAELLPLEAKSLGRSVGCPAGFTDEAVAFASRCRISLGTQVPSVHGAWHSP